MFYSIHALNMGKMKRQRRGIGLSGVIGAAGAAYATVKRARTIRRDSARVTGRATSFRSSRKRTKTRRQRGKRTGGDNSQLSTGTDRTRTFYLIRGGKYRPKLKNVSSISYYRYTSGQRVFTSVPGVQSVATLGYNGSSSSTAQCSLMSVYDLKGILAQIALQQVAAFAGTNLSGWQFQVTKAISDYYITNSTNANIILWLYDCVPRTDIHTEDTEREFPDYAWNSEKLQSNLGGVPKSAVPFATPFESSEFTHNYKVIGVKKLIMAPGVLHKHSVVTVQKKWISDTLWVNTITAGAPTTTVEALGKRSIFTMAVVMGGPAHYTAVPTSLGVTSSLGAIDVIVRRQFEYRFGTNAIRTIQQANYLQNAANPMEAVPEAAPGFAGIVIT